ncbi:hypothetical protein ATHEMM101B_07380 [Atlantibacter hermannii]|nr:Uncharacterised protein [Atlantibacter hermannii]
MLAFVFLPYPLPLLFPLCHVYIPLLDTIKGKRLCIITVFPIAHLR